MHAFKLDRQSQVIKSYKVISVLEQHVCHMLLFVMQCVDGACKNLALNRPFKWQFCSVMPFCMPWSCLKLVSIRAFLSTHRKSLFSLACVSSETHNLQRVFRPRGVVPYIDYIGVCRAKGYVFLAVLVWNKVSISTILVWNREWFVLSSLELGNVF